MPGSILNADINFPHFNGTESTEDKFNILTDYLYMLYEQLRYSMSNLGVENFNEEGMEDFIKIAAKGIDITGVVTFHDLETEGKTIIHGGNIITGTITTDQIMVNGSISFSGTLNQVLEEVENPAYIHRTYIDSAKIVGPYIIGGQMYATGQGDREGEGAAYYVCDGTNGMAGELVVPNAPKGWLCYDKHGDGVTEAVERVFLCSDANVALKIQSGGNLSIEANDRIYIESKLLLSSANYGTSLPDPTTMTPGTLFFLT